MAELPTLAMGALPYRSPRTGDRYFQIQATRPDTLDLALTDSPVGQLAWMVEKFKEWSHPSSELPEQSIDRDRG